MNILLQHPPIHGQALDPATKITFRVYGLPATAGSKRAFPFRRKGGSLGVSVTPDNTRARPWMAMVADAAQQVYAGPPLTGVVRAEATFFLPRPKGHFGTGRNAGTVRNSAPDYHIQVPDLSKLWRCAEDALRGIVWRDDCQVVGESLGKEWTIGTPGMVCTITVLDERETKGT